METLPAANARLAWTPRRVGLALLASLLVHAALAATVLLAARPAARHADDEATTAIALRRAAPTSPAPAVAPRDDRAHVFARRDASAFSAVPVPAIAAPAPDHASATSGSATTARDTNTIVTPDAGAPSTARPAAPDAAAGASTADTLRRDYLLQLGQRLAQALRYPADARLRGVEGRAQVHLHIARDGRVLSAIVSRGSGDGALDAGALETVRRAAPLPPFPAGLPDKALDVEMPLSFRLDARTPP